MTSTRKFDGGEVTWDGDRYRLRTPIGAFVIDSVHGKVLWAYAKEHPANDSDRDQKVRDTLMEKIIEKYGIEHYVTSAVHLTFDELRDLAREGDDRCTVMIEGGEVVGQ